MQILGHSIGEVVEIVQDLLEPKYQRVLQLRLQGLSKQKIADELGLTHEAVKYRLGRLQRKLHAKFADSSCGSCSL